MKDTRAELLAQAEILVRGRGYSGFSYADLAGAVGLRKASIHYHFPTKEDLGLALVAAYERRYDAALDAILIQHGDARARIDAYGRLYLTGVERGLGCLCAALAVELDTLPARLNAAIAAFFRKHMDWLAQVLAGGVAAGAIRGDVDVIAAARLIVASLEGALLLERLLGNPAGFERTLAAMLDGLAARAA